MNDYRTPEQRQASAEQDARVRKVLDQAVRDGASCMVAIKLGEPREVVERWLNASWNGLRDGLRDDAITHLSLRLGEDRLLAIVMLLSDRMQAEADKLLHVEDGPQ
jgi:hypothetical protein